MSYGHTSLVDEASWYQVLGIVSKVGYRHILSHISIPGAAHAPHRPPTGPPRRGGKKSCEYLFTPTVTAGGGDSNVGTLIPDPFRILLHKN